MDNRPIGVFDSGLGGLTVIKKLAEYLPFEDIIYLGDTGRVPYGSRSKETIEKYAMQDAAFLAGFNIKAMVIACNTVCSVALEPLKSEYSMNIYEVVNTPAKTAAATTKNGIIGVIGTAATIRSGAYEAAIKGISTKLTVHSVPCPLFVPLVEEGWINGSDITAKSVAERYLSQLRTAGVDTLIMGCTHYPLLREVISETMGKDVTLIDSGAETAKQVANDLEQKDLLRKSEEKGNIRYYVTDSIQGFSNLASKYLDSDVIGKVEQITLE